MTMKYNVFKVKNERDVFQSFIYFNHKAYKTDRFIGPKNISEITLCGIC